MLEHTYPNTHTKAKIVLTVHSVIFFSTIFLLFIFPGNHKYVMVICFICNDSNCFGLDRFRCIISDLENSHRYGSIVTFFDVVVGINANVYHNEIHKFVTYSSLLIKMYYAPSITYMFCSCILFLIYKSKKWIYSVILKKSS